MAQELQSSEFQAAESMAKPSGKGSAKAKIVASQRVSPSDKPLYFIDPGPGSGTGRLILAFTGGAQKFAGRNPFQFFVEGGLHKDPILLIKDQSRTCLMQGIPPEYDTFEKLVTQLRAFVDEHPHNKLLCTGTSSGGFSALLFGHLLGADKVVAFSPYTYISREKFIENSDPAYERAIKYIAQSMADEATYQSVLKYMDLKPLLSNWNGKTSYDIHVSQDSEWDVMRANYLSDCPNVNIHLHPYDTHGLVSRLMDAKSLAKCFE